MPLIPTPIDATVSIATSFAPSPIAKTLPGIDLTIFDFCYGVHLAKTTRDLFLYYSRYYFVGAKNGFSSSLRLLAIESTVSGLSPEIMTTLIPDATMSCIVYSTSSCN